MSRERVVIAVYAALALALSGQWIAAKIGLNAVPALELSTMRFAIGSLVLVIACDTAGIPLQPMPIRTGLALLADHYLDRLAALDHPDLLLDDDQRAALKRPITVALEEVRRKLALEPVRDA